MMDQRKKEITCLSDISRVVCGTDFQFHVQKRRSIYCILFHRAEVLIHLVGNLVRITEELGSEDLSGHY
jgi:alpha-tubulin suppressor-like RCC1 family protein